MFYHTRKVIQQNPFFYVQKDEDANLLIDQYDPSHPVKREYLVDKTKYEVVGNLGNILTSRSFLKKQIGTVRYMCGHEFILTKIYKTSLFETGYRYENIWTSPDDDLSIYKGIKTWIDSL